MSESVQAVQDRVQREAAVVEQLLAEVRRVIVGQRYLLERMVDRAPRPAATCCSRACPGLAKTLAVALLAGGGPRDLPAHPVHARPPARRPDRHADLQPEGRDVRRRARGRCSRTSCSPTRSTARRRRCSRALLEAMQERQVTIGDTTYPLPAPFLVLATQNPIEQEGTYPLPEAQVDRFMLKLKVDYPSPEEERADPRPHERAPTSPRRSPVVALDGPRARARRRCTRSTSTTGSRTTSCASCTRRARPQRVTSSISRGCIQYGASPRATLCLDRGRARARVPARARLRHARGRQGDRPRRAAPPADPLVRGRGRSGHRRRDRPARLRRGRGAVTPSRGAPPGPPPRDPHAAPRRREPRRLVPLGVQGARHGVRRGARVRARATTCARSTGTSRRAWATRSSRSSPRSAS